MKKEKCPHLGRLVSSYKFAGFVCNAQSLPTTMGQLLEWSKAEREAYMEKNGCYRGGCDCWLLKAMKEEGR